jgi:hypothetical protein
MNQLFDAIVDLFNAISLSTGIPYHELNILIYTFLIPATWWLIVWLRLRRLYGMGLLHMALPLFHYAQTAQHSRQFYDANVAALLYLGGGMEPGYVEASIVAGVVLPLLIYLSLLIIPKKWLIGWYFALIFINIAWYAWVLSRFSG